MPGFSSSYGDHSGFQYELSPVVEEFAQKIATLPSEFRPSDDGTPPILKSATNVIYNLGEEGTQILGGFTGQGSPIISVRGILGLPGYVLSGDIFDDSAYNDFVQVRGNKIVVFVNGIDNVREEVLSNEGAIEAFGVDNVMKAAVMNNTHFHIGAAPIGDVIQILTDEFGGITGTDIRAANQIAKAYSALVSAGVANPEIDVVAHSQGAMVLNRALDIIDGMDNGKAILSTVSVYTNGGERFISSDRGLHSVVNFVMSRDPVPTWGNVVFPATRVIEDMINGYRSYNVVVIPGGEPTKQDSWLAHHFHAFDGADVSVHYGAIYKSSASLQAYIAANVSDIHKMTLQGYSDFLEALPPVHSK
jgi:hypothetical protein